MEVSIQSPPCGTPTSFCTRKVFVDKIFFPFYFKTSTSHGIA